MDDTQFSDFLFLVDDHSRAFAKEINDFLLSKGCKCEIKTAKSGPVVSYINGAKKSTLANFVCRKSGVKIRIYAGNLDKYESFFDTLPDKMKAEIRKSSVCKRLINPADCNQRCPMGYSFFMDGEQHKKCRYMAFMPTLSEENNPFIKKFLENELVD